MLPSDDVTYQYVLSSVVSKHPLLALSVLCFFGFINGSRANKMILWYEKGINSAMEMFKRMDRVLFKDEQIMVMGISVQP